MGPNFPVYQSNDAGTRGLSEHRNNREWAGFADGLVLRARIKGGIGRFP